MSHLSFSILAFPPFFVLLIMTCLVRLFDRKLEMLNETFSEIFKQREEVAKKFSLCLVTDRHFLDSLAKESNDYKQSSETPRGKEKYGPTL